MNVKLYNDNGGETLTAEGQIWAKDAEDVLRPLVEKAVRENVSLKDLSLVITDELIVMLSIAKIRKGIEERKKGKKG